ncbi:MAG: L-seryl-tRNA(Sec) selenium transferase [Candidatus Binataceae bacterium]
MARQVGRKKHASESPDARVALLRALPPVADCVAALERTPEADGLRREYLKIVTQRAETAMRAAILAGRRSAASSRQELADEIVRDAIHAIAADEPALRTVVNATGVILHTNLGRALLAEQAIEAVERAARSPVNLEYDLDGGGRGERDELVEAELCALTGAQAATVVNNNAAAVLLALTAAAEGREVVVSRGELIEIGGSFRLPDVMSRSGAHLVEVGATNRTHRGDYERAIGPQTALLLKVHPSNYRVVGFTSSVGLGELVELGRARNIDVMEDLGSGALVDLSAYGLPREPLVQESIAAGAALVTFSGDKLLGGPQAGIVVGRRDLIEKLRANPLKRALRCDKMTLAALSATLRLYLRAADLATALPTLRLLTRSVDQLKTMAERARTILADRLGSGFSIDVVESTSQIGSGALPTEELATFALMVRHPDHSPDAIAAMFRRARPPVIGRIKNESFQLDLRTVEDPALLAVQIRN